MVAMTDSTGRGTRESGEDPLLHQLKNHLAVMIGFCDILLRELPAENVNRTDVQEMLKAGEAALSLLPELSKRMR